MISVPYLVFFALLVPASYLFTIGIVKFAYRWPLEIHLRDLLSRISASEDPTEQQYLTNFLDESKADLVHFDENKATQAEYFKVHGGGIYALCSVLALVLGLNPQSFVMMFLVIALWFMSAMDVAYRVIPEKAILLVASVGCLGLFLFDHDSSGFNANVAVLSFACFSLVLGMCLGLVNLWRILMRREERLTIGSGDVLLALGLCFWFGFDVLIITAIACFCMLAAQAWFSCRNPLPQCSREQTAFVYPFVPGLLAGVVIVFITPLSHWLSLNHSANIIAEHLSTLL